MVILLGDGSLRFTHKDLNGKPKLNTNALYAMTLKNKDYIYHLWQNIYNSIRTNTEPRLACGLPNPKTGKPISQYAFSTKSLPYLTLLLACALNDINDLNTKKDSLK